MEQVLSCCIPDFTFKVLYYYNFFTAFVHACSAITILILTINLDVSIDSEISKDGMDHTNQSDHMNYTACGNQTGISAGAVVDGPYFPGVCFTRTLNETDGPPVFTIEPEQMFDVKVYFGVLITIFFALSAIFQGGQGVFKTMYRDRVQRNDVNYIRYIEYSFSASVMMVAIACSLFVYDIYIHILVFTCTWLCMMLGLVVDYLRMIECNMKMKSLDSGDNFDWSTMLKHISQLKWFTHYLGWIAIFFPYFGVFFATYFRVLLNSSACLKDVPSIAEIIPTFVHIIVLSQLVLFSSFGLVQFLQLMDNPKDRNGNELLRPIIENPPKYNPDASKTFDFHFQSVPQNNNNGYPYDNYQYPYNQQPQENGALLNNTNNFGDVSENNDQTRDLYIYDQETKRIGIKTEVRFVTLSLIAKTLLGWLIAANLLFD
jgi:hypothetical protein